MDKGLVAGTVTYGLSQQLAGFPCRQIYPRRVQAEAQPNRGIPIDEGIAHVDAAEPSSRDGSIAAIRTITESDLVESPRSEGMGVGRSGLDGSRLRVIWYGWNAYCCISCPPMLPEETGPSRIGRGYRRCALQILHSAGQPYTPSTALPSLTRLPSCSRQHLRAKRGPLIDSHPPSPPLQPTTFTGRPRRTAGFLPSASSDWEKLHKQLVALGHTYPECHIHPDIVVWNNMKDRLTWASDPENDAYR
ncbi:uncharacterized protein MKK02DRAFT_29882 [Dioszegia hungarica]|uniref:Uncharacterized protein n=1 Tax=Dioszegia hungarica TaxID=4972 RepID=A0AA38LQC5_9TREE|nr:uncharacterized protein MKK02DRAFT_29882 [Dioszegia hungarica]KAI9633087.1 hypothetical protein MKK02DRAFT_29882 [Dioszegia hungarica]